MPRVFDETKLTAYVLGELHGEELEKLERHLDTSEEARREVEEISETTDLLRLRALAGGAPDRLTLRQRASIEESVSWEDRRGRQSLWWAGVAATVALAVAALLVWRGGPDRGAPSTTTSPSPRVAEVREGVEPAGQSAPSVAPEEVQVPVAVSRGAVQGRAVDTTGAAIPGATVRIAGEAPGDGRKTTTEASGEFLVSAVPAGRYTLTVELAGFRTREWHSVEVVGDRVADLGPMTLQVGALLRSSPSRRRRPAARWTRPGRCLQGSLARLRSLGYLGNEVEEALPESRLDVRGQSADFSTEAYDVVRHNPFVAVAREPLSTFSVDVDTASYANVRRFLSAGEAPPPGAVRIEELVNTFTYEYGPPRGEHPFGVHLGVTSCPWAEGHEPVRIGLKGREIDGAQRPPSNLVFLIDVSGSMTPPEKLPLLKRGLKLMIERLDERDRVAIVAYAGASGLVLPPTLGSDRQRILDALDRLSAGGTTHGSAGIRLAYQTATEGFLEGGANRVILATDGDFNVGITSQDELIRLIENQARSGVFLTVLGFGMGNYKDSTLEKLADRGNGLYAYVDTLREARKVLVDERAGTLVTIAKDVKIQVEFNPIRVAEYRLIGYENRLLAPEDFADDTKDAGEIGAGHSMTALYEIVPVGALSAGTVRPLKYQKPRRPSEVAGSGDLLTIQLRYKQPDGERSILLEQVLRDRPVPFEKAPEGSRFASAVAAFGMILRESPHKGTATLDDVERWARQALGRDVQHQRAEFLELVEQARGIPRR